MSPDEELSRLRVPPHSVEAEQSVLGALLLDSGSVWEAVHQIIGGGDFYRQEHRDIFGAMQSLAADRAVPFDVLTVFERLNDKRIGLKYLNDLAQSVPSARMARRYAEIVRERSMLRHLIAECDNAATAAFNPQGKSFAEVLDGAVSALSALQRGQMRKAPRVLGDLLGSRIDRASALADGVESPGMFFGIPSLDRATNGLKGGRVIVLAARPAVGKSSFAQSIGLRIAESYGPVLMLSQEMSSDEVADRAISNLGEVDSDALQTGRLKGDDWTAMVDAVERARELPFWVDDQPALRLQDIRAKARQVKGLRLLIVDYLQLSKGDGDNRVQQVGSISRGMKELAKDLDVPVLLLSQLNREVDSRPGQEPVLSDLRDSGEIEQDADMVVFMWPVRDGDGYRLIGCKVDKNRGGGKPRFALHFVGRHQRWHESAEPLKLAGGKPSKGGFE